MADCIQCGYCCTVRPCPYGEWDENKGHCKYLTEDTKCAIYNEIREAEKGTKYTMFGCGCSSPLFNTIRNAKLKELQREQK